MMPPRYTNMHRTAGTGPSSMMAAAVVTAATCAQEEKIQKHITPTNTENISKTKKLCEMATQTIAISSIFTSLDSNGFNQIPFVDQYVPNNNHHNNSMVNEEQQEEHEMQHDAAQLVVANNNKINQQQHGAVNAMATMVATTTAAVSTAIPASCLQQHQQQSNCNHITLQQQTNVTSGSNCNSNTNIMATSTL